jgi:hypothetical protein
LAVRGEAALILGGKQIEFLNAHELRKNTPFAQDVRNGNMVGDAIDPCPFRTTPIESLKTSPQLKVNLLGEVATLVRVGLIGAREPFERGTVLVRRVPVEVILTCLSGRDDYVPPTPR